MRITRGIENWGNTHHPKILDVIRMLLGILLVTKGYIFLNNAAYLRYLVIDTRAVNLPPRIITALIYYTIYIQLLGGVLIFLGLFTRLWCLLEAPIVFGAVFFVNITSPFVNSELWLSILVLSLLLLFIIIGSGPLSLDRLLSGIRVDEGDTSSLP
ncbi:MAG: DoxX family protein [Puia sp.]|nr:DoxX family protein [Puia sp.]